MKVTVKELKGKECVIEVESGWTVKHFKTEVEKQTGSPPECQRLILKGKVLKDEDTLEGSGVVDDSRIIVTEKKPGSTVQTVDTSSGVKRGGEPSNNDFWLQLHALLKRHFTESDAALVLDQCRMEFKMMTSSLSLDDTERLAGCLLDQR